MRKEGRSRIIFGSTKLVVLLGLLYLLSNASHSGGHNPSFAAWADTIGKSVIFDSALDAAPSDHGSRDILEKCWTLPELAGGNQDKHIERLRHPDLTPPRRTMPGQNNHPVPDRMQKSIRRVDLDTGHKYIALTFDLCERANEKTGYDADIVNYLRKNKIKATFFAGGKWMVSHPDKTIQLMADPLFELGNHAWTHGNMRLLSAKEMDEQILWTQAEYELLRDELIKKASDCRVVPSELERIPKQMQLFRFPYGTCKPEALDKLAAYGLKAIQWDVVTGDPAKNQNADGIAKTVLTQAKPGSIVIGHANGRGHGTAEALPIFIPELIKRGYKFVTVSELLAMGPVIASQECYELKPCDNQRYDKIFGKGTGGE